MAPFPQTSGALFPSVPLDKSRIEQVGQQNALESVSLWRKGVEHSPKQIALPPRDRDALTDLDTNTTSLAPPAAPRVASTSKPSARASTSTSIPRPAAVPDVFASTEQDRSLTAKSSLLSASAAQKRARDAATASASTAKKAKMEKDQQSQEEVWRAKWVKIFPTLIFHFEIGTEGQGRVLESRVKAMGAVSLLSGCFMWTSLTIPESRPVLLITRHASCCEKFGLSQEGHGSTPEKERDARIAQESFFGRDRRDRPRHKG